MGSEARGRQGRTGLLESGFYPEGSRECWEGSKQGSVTSALYVGNEPGEEDRRQRHSTTRKRCLRPRRTAHRLNQGSG